MTLLDIQIKICYNTNQFGGYNMVLTNDKLIFSSKEEIISNYKEMDISKLGGTSNIYKYKNDQIMKVFHNVASDKKKELIDIFKDYDPNIFSVPNLRIMIEDKLFGYTMDLFNGKEIHYIKNNTQLSNIFDLFDDKFDKQLEKMSNDKIKMWDMNTWHILFNNNTNKLCFIDFDGYKIEKEISPDELYVWNVVEITSNLLDVLLESMTLRMQLCEINRKHIQDLGSLKKVLYTIKEILERLTNKEITTIKDCRNAAKIIEKKYYKF